MKNEKKSYLIPCADIVDIRMEGPLLADSNPGGYGGTPTSQEEGEFPNDGGYGGSPEMGSEN